MLCITAISQCFDGVRNVLAGAYRGLQETKTPMFVGTIALWFLSIPIAYYLGFIMHDGAVGVRWGFTMGVIIATVVLSVMWYRDQNSLTSNTVVPRTSRDTICN